MKNLLKIGELSKESGVSIDTIRFYEGWTYPDLVDTKM